MKKSLFVGAAMAAFLLAAPASHAALVDAPVPTSAFVSMNGLDWAWALPVAAGASWFGPGDSSLDLSYQAQFGWRLPTDAELQFAPTAADFVFAGANVPAGGTDPTSGATFFGDNQGSAACATPYFSTVFSHCDWSDGRGVSGYDWALAGSTGFEDQLLVRDVPEPASILLLGAGLLGLGYAARRRGAEAGPQAA